MKFPLDFWEGMWYNVCRSIGYEGAGSTDKLNTY